MFSIYLNVHFSLLQFTTRTADNNGTPLQHHTQIFHDYAKRSFMSADCSGNTGVAAALLGVPAALPPVARNLTKDLEEMLDFANPELMLKTAWQSLVKQRSKNTPYRILTNVIPRKRIKKSDFGVEDFSLSTHATVGRLDRLLEEYRRWDGPVSAAVYISSEEDIDIFLAFVTDKARILKDIAIHVLMEDLSFMAKQYPNNILRNLAMSQLETDFFVALDVDFVTNVGAHGKLRELLTIYPNLTEVLRDKTLLVLPAFEAATYNVTFKNETGHEVVERRPKTLDAPTDKLDLLQKMDEGIVEPFHLKQFPPGHGPTRFPIYFDNRTGPLYPIEYHHRFEPYVLAYRHGLPRYWTGFRGYFFNKYSWFVETHAMGYSFAVLRDFFVFHVGISGGSTKIPAWKSREWQKFLRYKEQIHGNRTVTNFPGLDAMMDVAGSKNVVDENNNKQ